MSSLEKCAAASFPVLSTIFEIYSRVGIILPGPRERRGLNSFFSRSREEEIISKRTLFEVPGFAFDLSAGKPSILH
jgi:hypothetical protein